MEKIQILHQRIQYIDTHYVKRGKLLAEKFFISCHAGKFLVIMTAISYEKLILASYWWRKMSLTPSKHTKDVKKARGGYEKLDSFAYSLKKAFY